MDEKTSNKSRPFRNPKTFRLNKILIHNFKAIDELKIVFPVPRLPDDADVFLMGSRNGLGKTSVLEATAFVILSSLGGSEVHMRRMMELPINLPDLLIRAGAKETIIEASIQLPNESSNIIVELSKKGSISIKGAQSLREYFRQSMRGPSEDAIYRLLRSLAGLTNEPILVPPFMYFHSYRKVQEGNPELSMMVEHNDEYRRARYANREQPISAFKLEILRSMMSQASLFEDMDDTEAGQVLEQLNQLMDKYAGGRIEKLRPSRDNTIEFRVRPYGHGNSFTFDGLSSGQKEIISTLFMIWRNTRKKSGLIIIDEPELHLNVEWHKSFIRHLQQLAPNNQYIIATHSEDMFGTVPEDHRILLTSTKGDIV